MARQATPRVRVKICCIASTAEAQMAAEIGADLLGLVGPMPSGPGIIDLGTANAISASAPPWSHAVLLSSSETADAIAADAARAGVTTVQVVRHIALREAERLAAMPLNYLQVIHVEDHGALDLIDTYAPHCTAFLLDSGRPSQDALGGTGNTHDWDISAEFCRRASRPVFLAGGLTPENVADAIRCVQPFGIDICSGVRSNGRLDAGLLAVFMHAVSGAGQKADP